MKTKPMITVKARTCYGYAATVKGRLAVALLKVADGPARLPLNSARALADLTLIESVGDEFKLIPGTRFLELRVR
jgi:hypothetical protein